MTNRPHHRGKFYRHFYRASTFEILAQLRSHVSSGFANTIARLISQIYTATHPEVLEVVRDNLSLLQTQSASRRSAIRVFENFSGVLADYFSTHRSSPYEAAQRCPYRQGEHILQEAYYGGKGAVLATAHFGFFELGSALLADLGIPFTILTLPESTDAMTTWRANFRAHWGAESITIGSDPFASLEAVRALNRGRFVAMLVDRPIEPDPILMDMPGGCTTFSLAAARLANSAKCPIIPVAIWKSGDVYQMHTHEAVWVKPHESSPNARRLALEEATYKIAKSLLQNLTRAPEQWYQFIPVRA